MGGGHGRDPLPMALMFIQAVVTLANVALVAIISVSVWAAALSPPEAGGAAATGAGEQILATVSRLLIAALAGVVVGAVSWLIQWPLYRYAGIGDARRPMLWASGSFAVVFAAGLYATVQLVVTQP